jgi:hypothetical protein
VDTADTLRLTDFLTDVLVLTYLQGCTQQRGWREGVERVVLRLEVSKDGRKSVLAPAAGFFPLSLPPLQVGQGEEKKTDAVVHAPIPDSK